MTVGKLDYPVGILLRKIPVVRDDYDQLVAGQTLQGVENLLSGVGIKRTCRLVRHDYFRVLDKRTGNRDSLLLSTGKLVRAS